MSMNVLAAALAASMRVGGDVVGLHRQRRVDGQQDGGPLAGDLLVMAGLGEPDDERGQRQRNSTAGTCRRQPGLLGGHASSSARLVNFTRSSCGAVAATT